MDDVMQAAASLVDKSLVRRAEQSTTPRCDWYSWRRFANTVSTNSWCMARWLPRATSICNGACNSQSHSNRTVPTRSRSGCWSKSRIIFAPPCAGVSKPTRPPSDCDWASACGCSGTCAAAGPRGARGSASCSRCTPRRRLRPNGRPLSRWQVSSRSARTSHARSGGSAGGGPATRGASRGRTHPVTLPVQPR